ncbi:hypothetical protein D3C85_1477570 [compost metagenome]
MTGTAAQYGTDLQFLNTRINDSIRTVCINELITSYNDFACLRMLDRLERVASFNTVEEILDDFFTVLNTGYSNPFIRTTVIFTNDNVLCNVDQTASQVT